MLNLLFPAVIKPVVQEQMQNATLTTSGKGHILGR
jgi:hypothetical protein